jgi:hypothetical protein
MILQRGQMGLQGQLRFSRLSALKHFPLMDSHPKIVHLSVASDFETSDK